MANACANVRRTVIKERGEDGLLDIDGIAVADSSPTAFRMDARSRPASVQETTVTKLSLVERVERHSQAVKPSLNWATP